jgi:predicted peroxiredoxin
MEVAMAKILVHVTHGPENPTRAALAFLVAKTALINAASVAGLLLTADCIITEAPKAKDEAAGEHAHGHAH